MSQEGRHLKATIPVSTWCMQIHSQAYSRLEQGKPLLFLDSQQRGHQFLHLQYHAVTKHHKVKEMEKEQQMKKVWQSRWKEAKEPEGKKEPQKAASPEVFDVVFSSQQLERELEGFAVNMGLSWGPPVHICTHHKCHPINLGFFLPFISVYMSLISPNILNWAKKATAARRAPLSPTRVSNILVSTFQASLHLYRMVWSSAKALVLIFHDS